ncbi:hypothetical protein [Paenibacillus polymyxa]|uniref:hypothetical protein n=1 Tax=Paenibacillus polymyxa TaxID=1406 RepID=UPI000A63E224|nr:hypothetical protein [Paenibacillus polymyxa]
MVKRKLSMLLICFMVFSLPLAPAFAADLGYYDEPYRNQIHFSPEANWMTVSSSLCSGSWLLR